MKRARASDMRQKIKVYEQVNVRDVATGTLKTKWRYVFSLWCRESTIFRQQLEGVISGAITLKDRKEFECRYTTKLTTQHRIEYRGAFYRVSIVGDTQGKSDRIRFLAEALKDGGA